MTISAKIIAYSRDYRGRYIVSWELEYPRFIHGEFMTHRLFSRNAASSRAIPVKAMIDAVRNNPAKPIHWGMNQPGMQAKQELEPFEMASVMRLWDEAAWEAADTALAMDLMGAHKQIANRILEPFQTMKTVMTATCLDNFFWLRNHEDAQPEIKELARLMWEALQGENAVLLEPGDWHVPYFGEGYWLKNCGIPLEDALAISASCCAQVSYRKLDDTLEKAHIVFKRLVESKPVHASPFEHQATPMECYKLDPIYWPKGVTHLDKNMMFWSGNFVGFIQHRQLLDDHTCWEYKG
ncbi:putative thymidylate synthase [Pseudomonas phage UAVern]|uniref:Thymidylate synthase n=1 Tax=Pseudomonas phage UAVern TaxID=2856997 RepID=A0A975UX02_9CAUD|nr:putative thymidylate synthase [Pseudomonas phage UAVern]